MNPNERLNQVNDVCQNRTCGIDSCDYSLKKELLVQVVKIIHVFKVAHLNL